MVPTTCERCAGSATNGVVYDVASAQEYSREAESAVRLVAQSRPPPASSQSIWFRLFSTAIGSDRMSGTQRPLPPISSTRSRAAGLIRDTHSPPSPAKFFCGAK
ncbi:Uncharacterised protein [Mycobacteroides abscessus subsp. abscessus]|nr:Uncharacterised protein [Mycobacteroides abscessus subsp. abscessus]